MLLENVSIKLETLGVAFTCSESARAADSNRQQLTVLLRHPYATTYFEVKVDVQKCRMKRGGKMQLALQLPSGKDWADEQQHLPASSERLWHGAMPGEPGSCWHRGALGGLMWTSSSEADPLAADTSSSSSSSSSSEVPEIPPAVFYKNRDVCAAAHHVCSLAPAALAAACR
jgi:hypothetical protein